MTDYRELSADSALGELEPVAFFEGAMLTSVTVSHGGRIFVNFPKWGDDVQFTVAEVSDGEVIPYPDRATNETSAEDPAAALVSVQSVVVDPGHRQPHVPTDGVRWAETALRRP